MHETVTKLADEMKKLWMATDSLSSLTGWPDDLTASNKAPTQRQPRKNCSMADGKTARNRNYAVRFNRRHLG